MFCYHSDNICANVLQAHKHMAMFFKILWIFRGTVGVFDTGEGLTDTDQIIFTQEQKTKLNTLTKNYNNT